MHDDDGKSLAFTGVLHRRSVRPVFAWHCRLLAKGEAGDDQFANLKLLDAALSNAEFANRKCAHGHSAHRDGSYSSRTRRHCEQRKSS